MTARTPAPLIAITTGDADGIGLEVTLKALHKIGPRKKIKFIVFQNESTPRFLAALAKRVRSQFGYESLEFVTDNSSPALWVEVAARRCLKGDYAAMVTGPLSKETIVASGFNDIGHTDILQRIAKSDSVHMGFVGEHFNVVLATGHIPLNLVATSLTAKSLSNALTSAQKLRSYLPKILQSKPIAFVGLNPHAGENGLIGLEEGTLYKKFLSTLPPSANVLKTPLVPDAAFLKSTWGRYSVYVCAYHDQGLIPFKTVHGHDQGVHTTLGLPFLRLSVDHGTAKDIFGTNCANPGSMISVLTMAEKLVKRSTK